jgi:two-component sensor histidine kinase
VDMLSSGLTSPEMPVQMSISGTAGELDAEVATPLALVLSELLQNCVEHAFPDRAGQIHVRLERGVKTLTMRVSDDGVGLPEGWSLQECSNLGLQIASTLVETEMRGELTVCERPDGVGTQAIAKVRWQPI